MHNPEAGVRYFFCNVIPIDIKGIYSLQFPGHIT